MDETLWETKLVEDEKVKKEEGYVAQVTNIFAKEGDFLGGNLSYSLGTVFVSTKKGFIFAINENDGKILWSKNLGAPFRSAPVAKEYKVVVVTVYNQTIAFNKADGKKLWHHQALAERSRMINDPTPILIGDKLIVTYTTGDIYALDYNDGTELWTATAPTSEYGRISTSISDISQNLVYSGGKIFVVSPDGTLSALDESGSTLWSFEGEAINKSPWVVGDMVFASTQFGELMAVSASEGKLLWKNTMALPEDIEDDEMVFTGLVMAAGNLYAADNQGNLYKYSAKNGELIEQYSIPSEVFNMPMVASGKCFWLPKILIL
jgi:outer membrane protein assembly factor BamB